MSFNHQFPVEQASCLSSNHQFPVEQASCLSSDWISVLGETRVCFQAVGGQSIWIGTFGSMYLNCRSNALPLLLARCQFHLYWQDASSTSTGKMPVPLT
ncbi:MAG: hypothetical protein F6J92_19120 [Symploca sp. SIO1A3]|nr:hypothetical protein [Symploca sp. SIO1A3]